MSSYRLDFVYTLFSLTNVIPYIHLYSIHSKWKWKIKKIIFIYTCTGDIVFIFEFHIFENWAKSCPYKKNFGHHAWLSEHRRQKVIVCLNILKEAQRITIVFSFSLFSQRLCGKHRFSQEKPVIFSSSTIIISPKSI